MAKQLEIFIEANRDKYSEFTYEWEIFLDGYFSHSGLSTSEELATMDAETAAKLELCALVDSGVTIYWRNKSYLLINGGNAGFLIMCNNGCAVGFTDEYSATEFFAD